MPVGKTKLFLLSLLLLVAVNLIFLDIVVFLPKGTAAVNGPAPTETPQDSCGPECRAAIAVELAERLPAATTPVAPTPAPAAAVAAPRGTREFIIPVGSGITRNNEYEEIAGAEVYINSVNYPLVTKVTFEASMRIPTANGRMYVKLYNSTDKHDVWFSELTSEGNASVRKEATVSLDAGNKLYRLMAKSTLKYEAIIDNAIVKIVTN